MNYKYYFLFITIIATVRALETVNGRIKIKVVTTSGCRDTMNFISNQLTPTYEEFKDFIDVHYVPWGRTTVNDNGELICQFGENDCKANRIHRCALNKLNNTEDQVKYMACEFKPPYPAYTSGSYECANNVGINLVDLHYCVTVSGGPLDDAAAEAAAEPMNVINFVPSIVFNDKIDIDLHNEARRNLRSLACIALSEDPSTGITSCQL